MTEPDDTDDDEAINFAKMAADLDTNPKIRRAGRNAREVYLFVLRRVALFQTQGRIPVSNVDAWYLSDSLMCTEAEAAEGLERCLERFGEMDPLLEITGGKVVVVGWDDEWARRPLSPAQRQQRKRDRAKARAEEVPPSTAKRKESRRAPIVTTSRDVTDRHDESRAVPQSHAHHGSDQIREEEIREDHVCGSGEIAISPTHTPFDPSGWSPEPSDANTLATLEASRLGVVVDFALKKFRLRAAERGWTQIRCAAEWPLWLAKEHPTNEVVRDALSRVDREKNKRAAEERERSERAEAERLVAEDREAVQRELDEFRANGGRPLPRTAKTG